MKFNLRLLLSQISLLALVSLAAVSSALAAGSARVADDRGEIRSEQECKVDLRYRGPRNARYAISGSRSEGTLALKRIAGLLNAGASPLRHRDSLGILRYSEVTSAEVALRVMEQKWMGVGACEGLVRALLVDVCTYDNQNAACETQCRFDGTEGFCP
jgi:hypothetical protein